MFSITNMLAKSTVLICIFGENMYIHTHIKRDAHNTHIHTWTDTYTYKPMCTKYRSKNCAINHKTRKVNRLEVYLF